MTFCGITSLSWLRFPGKVFGHFNWDFHPHLSSTSACLYTQTFSVTPMIAAWFPTTSEIIQNPRAALTFFTPIPSTKHSHTYIQHAIAVCFPNQTFSGWCSWIAWWYVLYFYCTTCQGFHHVHLRFTQADDYETWARWAWQLPWCQWPLYRGQPSPC